MHRILKPILLAAVAATAFAVSPASSADEAPRNDARFRQLGDCMAFYAVAGGVDGKTQVDPALAATITALGSELMFEASVLGYDDDKAQTYVVNKLVERNTEVNEKGSAEMTASYGPMCSALAESLTGKAKPKG